MPFTLIPILKVAIDLPAKIVLIVLINVERTLANDAASLLFRRAINGAMAVSLSNPIATSWRTRQSMMGIELNAMIAVGSVLVSTGKTIERTIECIAAITMNVA